MKLLFAPLQRLANLMEIQTVESTKLQSVLTVSIADASKIQVTELQKQTTLLEDIRGLLRIQSLSAKKEKPSGGATKGKMPSFKGAKSVAVAIGLFAGAILVSSVFFALMPNVPLRSLLTALAVAGILTLVVPQFMELTKLYRFKMKNILKAAAVMPIITMGILAAALPLMLMPKINPMSLLSALVIGVALNFFIPSFIKLVHATKQMKVKDQLKASASMAIMALGIVGVALVFAGLGAVSGWVAPPLGWTLSAGLSILIFSYAFSKITASIKGQSTKGIIMTALALPLMALSIVGIAYIFKLFPTDTVAPPLGWTIKVGLSMFLISFAFTKILKVIKGLSNKDLIKGGIALPIMAAAVIGIAYIFKAFPADTVAPDLAWTIKVGLSMFLIAFAFTKILKAMQGVSIKNLIMAGLALPVMAAAVVGIAFIFQALGSISGYETTAPDLGWSLKVGLSLLIFSIPFILVAVVANKIGVKGIALGALSMIAIAGAILAAAWIFSFLPGDFTAPPMDWAIGAAIAITAFAIPLAVIGLLATVLTPAGLLLGAAGIILIAGTMWVVAWIFSKLPDLSAISKNFTDAIMYPINAMIDGLKRFKDEIGIDNMIPLAGGILAIAGSWLVLTAAMAGQGIGGAIGAVGNAIGQGIDKLTEWFGGEKSMGPKDLLELLISKADSLKKIAGPMNKIGMGFKGIGLHAASVQMALGALIPFTQEDEVEELTDAATAIKKIATGYASIANSTNVMNIDALNASANMFNAIARVAESDGNDVLTKISEELMEAVRKLSETVKNLEESNGKNSESMTDSISNTLTGFIDKIKGSDDKASGETGLVDIGPIVSAIQDLEDRFSRPLKVQEI
tara:strand:- start:439 stop:3003 length:2565 start_codon:yes stop_codon:yes gene_type:complete